MPDQTTQIREWLSSQEQAMHEMLEALVNIDSGSYDKAGVDAAGEVVSDFLKASGIPCEVTPIAEHGVAIKGTVPSSKRNRNILLLGHRDTVFPKGEAARRPFSIKDGRAYGPGVADMKSGIVMNCFVAAAFAKFGGAPAPIVLLCTGDEEIGSPSSSPIITEEARNAFAVFNAEAGRASGNVVVARRGCIFIRIVVHGRSAHSGVDFSTGRSAIEELAHKTVAIAKLTDSERMISANVGLVSGGQSVNTVAPEATASIDIRYYTPSDREKLLGAIEAIVGTATVEGTSATSEIYGEFPPLNNGANGGALFETYRETARSLGTELDGELTRGAADSGFTAAAGAPTLCGTGPVGGRYHSEEEYIELDSLLQRAQILAATIQKLQD